MLSVLAPDEGPATCVLRVLLLSADFHYLLQKRFIQGPVLTGTASSSSKGASLFQLTEAGCGIDW